jgi:saccharopine dehydrogenase (NAD+, L-lysine-forming)
MADGKTIVMLGSGIYGAAFIRELLRESETIISKIVLADIDRGKAESLAVELGGSSYEALAACVDASDEQSLLQAIKGVDLVVNITGPFEKTAVPAIRAAIKSKIDYIDINGHAASTREVLALEREVREAGISVLIGFGDTPGMVNIFARRGADQLDEVHEIHIGAGGSGGGRKGLAGLSRVWHNVISDPALVYRDGQVREVPARQDKELIWLPEFDEPMEVMSARHTEVLTLPRFIPGVKLVTYKVGFFPKAKANDVVCTLFDWGMNSQEPIDVQGVPVVPAEFALSFLVSAAYAQAMGLDKVPFIIGYQVRVIGTKNGRPAQVIYRFRDTQVSLTQTTLAAGVKMMLRGEVTARGIIAPEGLNPEPFIAAALSRGMILQELQE